MVNRVHNNFIFYRYYTFVLTKINSISKLKVFIDFSVLKRYAMNKCDNNFDGTDRFG